MKSDDTSMYDDPSTPAYMRELLQAGRRGQADYDVERGLAEHLARIGATLSPAATQWAAGAGAGAGTAAVKSSLPAWLGFVVMPLAAAGIASLIWTFASQPAAPAITPSNAVPSGIVAPGVGNTMPSNAPSNLGVAIDDRGGDDTRAHAGPDRRSRGSRSSAPHAARGSRAVSGTAPGSRGASDVNENDFEAATNLRTDDSAPARDVSGDQAAVPNPYVGSRTELKPQPAREAAREPAVEEQDDRPAAAAKPAAKPAGTVVVDESRLEREMQMLAVTQRILASNPERALRLAQQGEREFAGSMFSAERRQLGLLALVKLGRLDEARRAGRPFLARYPNAPWSERLRRALATGTVE